MNHDRPNDPMKDPHDIDHLRMASEGGVGVNFTAHETQLLRKSIDDLAEMLRPFLETQTVETLAVDTVAKRTSDQLTQARQDVEPIDKRLASVVDTLNYIGPYPENTDVQFELDERRKAARKATSMLISLRDLLRQWTPVR